MGSRWPSARHCHRALKQLLNQLSTQFPEGLADPSSGISATGSGDISYTGSYTHEVAQDATPGPSRLRGTKRKIHDDIGDLSTDQFHPTAAGTLPFPVLEYNGPDFGFDATQLATLGPPHNLASESNPDTGGFFGNVGWDAFIQGLGYDGRFNL